MNDITPELLVSHADSLYAFAQRRVEDHYHTEDLVQQCLVIAWRKRETFRGEAMLRTWLIGILKFLILDFHRRTRKTPTHDSLHLDPGIDDMATSDVLSSGALGRVHHDYVSASSVKTPADDAQQAEVLVFIQECIQQLPDRARLIFVLREVDGLSLSAVAAAAGVTSGSASVILTRARYKLRACLKRRGVIP